MPRTILTIAVPAVVIAVAWLRLESPVDYPPTALVIVLLAVFPAGVRRLRPLAAAGAFVLAARIAFGEWPRHPGRIWTHFEQGFLDFYDVRTPFDPRIHGDMRGIVLAAIFAFILAVGAAVAARRPGLALGALLVGAGWPATLAGSRSGLAVGAAILVAALAVLVGLTSRRVPRAVVPVAGVLALAAVAASMSSAVAKGSLVSWQRWDFYNAPAQPVSVSYVWNAQYTGITFPKKRTRVLEIEAPRRSLFWRAAVLDDFSGDRWIETVPQRGDWLEPAVPSSQLLRQRVHVLALADTRLVGASVPISFDAGDAPIASRGTGFAELPSGLTRGFTYTVESYAPRPTPAELTRSPADYPAELTERGTFLDVWPGVTAPPFGAPRRAFLDRHPAIARYTPLLSAALDVAGNAPTPYAATTALLSWFRSSGQFRYTNRPAVDSYAPLVGFVADTRAGYCQQFAGAMALMLRYLGIPARVTVGFSSGTYDAKRGRWLVSDHDAHAWVEAWFRGYGWLPFDPTPAAGRPERGQLSAPYARASGSGVPSSRASVPAAQPDVGSAHHHGEQGTGARPGFATAAPGPGNGHSSLLLLLVLVAAAVVGGIVATKVAVRRVRYLTRDPRRIAGACRRELAEYLLDQQIEGARSATLYELGGLVRHELAVDPDAFVAAATAARFGRPEDSAAAARVARRELRSLLRTVRRRLNARDRARGLLSLRSLGFAQ